jgi:hypothetical protein
VDRSLTSLFLLDLPFDISSSVQRNSEEPTANLCGINCGRRFYRFHNGLLKGIFCELRIAQNPIQERSEIPFVVHTCSFDEPANIRIMLQNTGFGTDQLLVRRLSG